jgi:hypothetical protein
MPATFLQACTRRLASKQETNSPTYLICVHLEGDASPLELLYVTALRLGLHRQQHSTAQHSTV